MSEQRSAEHLPVHSSSEDSVPLSSRDRSEADVRDGVNWLLDLLPTRSHALRARLDAWQRDAIASIREEPQ